MPKKFTILWIVFGFFPYALTVEGAAAAAGTDGSAAKVARGLDGSRATPKSPTTGGAGGPEDVKHPS